MREQKGRFDATLLANLLCFIEFGGIRSCLKLHCLDLLMVANCHVEQCGFEQTKAAKFTNLTLLVIKMVLHIIEINVIDDNHYKAKIY